MQSRYPRFSLPISLRWGLIPALALAGLSWSAGLSHADSLVEDRLSVGLYVEGGGLADSEAEAGDLSELETGGGGLDLRYRIARRWDIELSAGALEGENDSLRRSMDIVTIGARFHFNPESKWRWSLAAGIGSASETVEVFGSDVADDDDRPTAAAVGEVIERSDEYEHVVAYFGGSVERSFGRILVTAEIRAMALGSGEDAVISEIGRPIPEESSGGQFRLQAAYRF